MSAVPPGDDPGEPGDAPDPDDPFADLTLDEEFVRAAPINEPAAEDRARAAEERARRQAQLRRLLAEQQAHPSQPPPGSTRFAPGDWDDWDAEPEPRPRRRSTTVRTVALVLLVAIVSVYVLSHLVGIWANWRTDDPVAAPVTTDADDAGGAGGAGAGSDGVAPADPSVDFVRPDDWPPPPPDALTAPLGEPAPVPGDGGPHEFLALQPDGANPVAYDPCRPIHYVTRPGGPPEGDVLIREALASVSTATGLRFVDDGATEEAPSDDRAPHQPDVYGDRWAPVLFAWSDPVESPRLGEIDPDQPQADPAAYAGSTGVTWEPAGASSRMVYVTGSVTLDGPDLTDISEGPDGRARALAIIEHEVGHLVGLGHVDDRRQLMFPTIQPQVTSFGAGDLEGLAKLGRGACFPEV